MRNDTFPAWIGLSMADERIQVVINDLIKNGRFEETKGLMQHGGCSVYDHCVRVAELSLAIAERHHKNVDFYSLIRGALLHDYFLYDWHDKENGHSLHGFTHPYSALIQAKKDFALSKKEEDIIIHHMFPLNVFPPICKEAWIVCVADKLCATQETAAPYMLRIQKTGMY